MRDDEYTLQIDIEGPVPYLVGQFLEPAPALNRCIIDEDQDGAERFPNARHSRCHTVTVADIDSQCQRPAAILVDLSRNLLGPFPIDVENRYRHSITGKTPGNRCSHAIMIAGAGDQGNFHGIFIGHVLTFQAYMALESSLLSLWARQCPITAACCSQALCIGLGDYLARLFVNLLVTLSFVNKAT